MSLILPEMRDGRWGRRVGGGTNLLLLGEVIPHARQQPGQLALRQVRPLLLQLLPLLLREDEHGRDGPLGLL